jgi:hypothetical protein
MKRLSSEAGRSLIEANEPNDAKVGVREGWELTKGGFLALIVLFRSTVLGARQGRSIPAVRQWMEILSRHLLDDSDARWYNAEVMTVCMIMEQAFHLSCFPVNTLKSSEQSSIDYSLPAHTFVSFFYQVAALLPYPTACFW